MPKRVLNGKVVSCNSNKTVVIEVTRLIKHKLYKKFIRKNKRFHAHDENNNCVIGQDVSIEESKPISKLKRWIVINNSQESEKQ